LTSVTSKSHEIRQDYCQVGFTSASFACHEMMKVLRHKSKLKE